MNRTRVVAIISATLLALPSLALATFDVDLRYGARGSAVIELQQFLISRGLLSSDSATGYFGPLTLVAVKAFQSSQGVQPVSGFFGSLTRAAANMPNNTLGVGVVIPPSTDPTVAAKISALLAQIQQLQAQIATLTKTLECADCVNPYPPKYTPPLSAVPTSGATPLTVQFSSTAGGLIEFGDGTSRPMTPVLGVCAQGATGGAIGCDTGATEASHTYTSPGTYTARLLKVAVCAVPAGEVCQLSQVPVVIATATITVTGTSNVTFSASPTSGSVPLAVTFTGRANANAYTIDFGDGSAQQSSQCIDDCPGFIAVYAAHTYTSPGIYTVKLLRPFVCGNTEACAPTPYQVIGTATITVTAANKCGLDTFSVSNECGAGEYRNASIQCYDGHTETLGGPTSCKPTATWRTYADAACANRCSITNTTLFSASVTSGQAPLTVSFSGSPTAPTNIDFGDGQIAQNYCTGGGYGYAGCDFSVTHIYTQPGTYTANLLGPGCDPGAPSTCMSIRPILGTVTITVTQ